MQKSGLDSQGSDPKAALDLQIAREQAESLGLAGRRLQESIDQYHVAFEQAASAALQTKLLGEISSRAWALMVQREHVGFRHEARRWVLENFDIPERALSHLGHAGDE